MGNMEAKKIARDTFDEAWRLTGAVFGISAQGTHDRFVESHIEAITRALILAYQAGYKDGSQLRPERHDLQLNAY